MSRRNSLARRASLQRGSIQHDQTPTFNIVRMETKTVDMDSGAQKHVEMIAEDAFEKHTSEKEIAAAIRASMDQAYGKYWNVVVGRHFGSDVTHVTKQYIQMQYGPLNILVWKSS